MSFVERLNHQSQQELANRTKASWGHPNASHLIREPEGILEPALTVPNLPRDIRLTSEVAHGIMCKEF
jgi:hypothetical protein